MTCVEFHGLTAVVFLCRWESERWSRHQEQWGARMLTEKERSEGMAADGGFRWQSWIYIPVSCTIQGLPPQVFI